MAEVRPIDGKLLLKRLATEQLNAHPLDYSTNATYAECMKTVETMPTLDYEPVRHGRWEYQWFDAVCSNCGFINKADPITRIRDNPPFCPKCNAKMDGGKCNA